MQSKKAEKRVCCFPDIFRVLEKPKKRASFVSDKKQFFSEDPVRARIYL